MKATIIWASPEPERTIAVAMRRCYSTKPIDELEKELDEKGMEYFRHLISLAFRDKSLDVIEHFYMEVLLEETNENELFDFVASFPFARFTKIASDVWLLTLNARTLVEAFHRPEGKRLSLKIMESMRFANVGKTFLEIAFGEELNES